MTTTSRREAADVPSESHAHTRGAEQSGLQSMGLFGPMGPLASCLQVVAKGWKLLGLDGRAAQTNKQLHIVETLTIGPKKQLVLVRCGEERFLVGTGPDSVQTIVRLSSQPEVQAREGVSAE